LTKEFTDREYLRKEQYRDGGNLRQRASLHERYSTNRVRWHAWVFSQLDLPPAATILEAGCGPGFLWSENLEKVPRGLRVTLSDLSPGMVAEARGHLSGSTQLSFLCCDLHNAPVPPATFDAVIANHMLYHVPDVAAALAEVHRLLKPGGKLYAATNGERHLQEIAEFASLARADPEPEARDLLQRAVENFSLETGREKLAGLFEEVEIRRYPDALHVTEAEPLVRYVASSSIFRLDEDGLERLRELLARDIASLGMVRVQKDTGLFIARKASGT
jgi:ubiquinone/menaquinone biosynthesis C-methylase UbiE